MDLSDRDLALKVAWSFLGRPYKWGGDDPMTGFDCSGFIIECLKAPGILPRKGDWTAQGLADRLGPPHLDIHALKIPGDLIFWNNSAGSKIIHVEMLVTSKCCIGAGGGGSRTRTVQDAIDQNAYIKVRPWATRKNVAGFVNPYN